MAGDNMDMSLLKVRVYSGNEAVPIENAKVLITREGRAEAFLITDETGATPFIKLKAPKRAESLDSSSDEKSFIYRGDVYAEGFYPAENLFISLVGGTSSVLKVNLIPSFKGGRANV